MLPEGYELIIATQITSGKDHYPWALSRRFGPVNRISHRIATKGEDSTLTDMHESVSNEGNTQLDEAMDTDQRQTLIGINQGKDLERLTSDVMNQKVSPNALAESQELVKLDNTLACLKNTLKST